MVVLTFVLPEEEFAVRTKKIREAGFARTGPIEDDNISKIGAAACLNPALDQTLKQRITPTQI
jgi:hypothetical protein